MLQVAEAIVEFPGRTGTVGSAWEPRDALSRASVVGQRLVELVRSILGCQRVSITTVDLRTGELRSLVAPLEVARQREGEFEGRMVSAVAARKNPK